MNGIITYFLILLCGLSGWADNGTFSRAMNRYFTGSHSTSINSPILLPFSSFAGIHPLSLWERARVRVDLLSESRALPLAQTDSTNPSKPVSPMEGTPIGGSEQNWGAMIVFAVGIGIFIIAYLYFRSIPATKKKKKKHF